MKKIIAILAAVLTLIMVCGCQVDETSNARWLASITGKNGTSASSGAYVVEGDEKVEIKFPEANKAVAEQCLGIMQSTEESNGVYLIDYFTTEIAAALQDCNDTGDQYEAAVYETVENQKLARTAKIAKDASYAEITAEVEEGTEGERLTGYTVVDGGLYFYRIVFEPNDPKNAVSCEIVIIKDGETQTYLKTTKVEDAKMPDSFRISAQGLTEQGIEAYINNNGIEKIENGAANEDYVLMYNGSSVSRVGRAKVGD